MDRKLLDSALLFIGVKDFWLNRESIKEHFKSIGYLQMTIYKWYIYQQPFLSEGNKDIMWELINDDVDDEKALEKLKRHLK